MKLSKYKRCPRCNTKVPSEVNICPGCSLNYIKFNQATNKQAKIALKSGQTDKVLLRRGLPNDVNKTTLLLLTIFLGFTGAHYYYVGRVKMGLFFSFFCIIGIINVIVNSVLKDVPTSDWFQVFVFLVLVWGFVLMLWIIDIAKVIFNRFKVPVSRE